MNLYLLKNRKNGWTRFVIAASFQQAIEVSLSNRWLLKAAHAQLISRPTEIYLQQPGAASLVQLLSGHATVVGPVGGEYIGKWQVLPTERFMSRHRSVRAHVPRVHGKRVIRHDGIMPRIVVDTLVIRHKYARLVISPFGR